MFAESIFVGGAVALAVETDLDISVYLLFDLTHFGRVESVGVRKV